MKRLNPAAKTLNQSGVSYMMRRYWEGNASAKKRHGEAGTGETDENRCRNWHLLSSLINCTRIFSIVFTADYQPALKAQCVLNRFSGEKSTLRW